MTITIRKDNKIEYKDLVDLPLYSKFIFEPLKMGSPQNQTSYDSWSNHSEAIQFLNEPVSKFNAYCLKCKENRIFSIADKIIVNENWRKNNAGPPVMFYDGIRYHEFECSLNSQHRISFTYKVGYNYVMKIGQYPSSADLLPVPKDYSIFLPDEKLLELKRAIGLQAFGIGIGSFVYLRRIIEYLIQSAHMQAKNNSTWKEEQFQKNDIQKRIKMLKGYLPDFLTENNTIYGILSKGVHELTEEDCLDYFPVLYNSIELILDEQLQSQRKKERSDLLNKEINLIRSNITKKAK